MTFPTVSIEVVIHGRTTAADAVLVVLAELKTQNIHEVTIEALAAAVDYSPRTVARALDDLELRGQISRERCGWRRTYVYGQVAASE